MVSGSIDTGLINLASYIGNVIMPAFAGLLFCTGLYHLAHKTRAGEHYLTATIVCLSASGLIRLAESFAGTTASADQYYNAILSLANWVANVIMPAYAVVNFIRAWLAYSDSGITSGGGSAVRHGLVGVACLGSSMGLRLIEWFITSGAGGIK